MLKYFLALLCVNYALSFPENLISKTLIDDLVFENEIEPLFEDAFPMMRSEAASWSYDEAEGGPSSWSVAYPACGGTTQSPINLKSTSFVKKSYSRKLLFNNYKSVPSSINLINSGHSVQLELTFNSEIPSITGGPLVDEYQFRQFHFHWGSANSVGSEHFLDGKQYAMEVHLVHFNKKYESFESAMDKPDGLTVLGVFFNVKAATPYITFTQYLETIEAPHTTQTITDKLITLSTLVGSYMEDFVTYSGSLTTPPCYQTVQWIVSTKVQYITPDEIAEFRQLYDSHEKPMVNNFRPVQALNNRSVFYCSN